MSPSPISSHVSFCPCLIVVWVLHNILVTHFLAFQRVINGNYVLNLCYSHNHIMILIFSSRFIKSICDSGLVNDYAILLNSQKLYFICLLL